MRILVSRGLLFHSLNNLLTLKNSLPRDKKKLKYLIPIPLTNLIKHSEYMLKNKEGKYYQESMWIQGLVWYAITWLLHTCQIYALNLALSYILNHLRWETWLGRWFIASIKLNNTNSVQEKHIILGTETRKKFLTTCPREW